MGKYRWGILGTGNIAGQFAKGLSILSNAIPYAVASRSKEKADSFAKEYGYEKVFGSYEELLDDSSVDIVYIATPNHLHFPLVMQCLEAGKHVLCEKPFALNPVEAKEMLAKAKEKHLFLMEAMWTCFLPSMQKVKEQLSSGRIGRPVMLKAEFGIHPEYNAKSRLFSPEMGGGSVYDIGIYPLFLALYFFGEPESMQVTTIPAPTGVDMTSVIVMNHKENVLSVLHSSFACSLKSDATFVGDNGSLRLDRMFHMPTQLYFSEEYATEEQIIPIAYEGNGYNYEAAEVMSCLDRGVIESERYTHDFALLLSTYIDKINRLSHEENK